MLHMEWSINYKNYNAKEIAYIVAKQATDDYFFHKKLKLFKAYQKEFFGIIHIIAEYSLYRPSSYTMYNTTSTIAIPMYIHIF